MMKTKFVIFFFALAILPYCPKAQSLNNLILNGAIDVSNDSTVAAIKKLIINEKAVENRNTEQRNPNKTQNTLHQIVDSVYNWAWNSSSLTWELKSRKNTYTYDSLFRNLTWIQQSKSGSVWTNTYYQIYEYDSFGNLSNYLRKKWQNNTWINSNQTIRNSDSVGNLLSSTSQKWNDTLLFWENQTRYLSTYNSDNLITSNLYQEWDTSAWLNKTNDLYTYSNGKTILHLYQIWDTTNWQNASKDTSIYNASMVLQSRKTIRWDGINWRDTLRITFNYIGTNLSSEIVQKWNGLSWQNSTKNEYSYNVGPKPYLSTYFNWNLSTWEYISKDSSLYNSQGIEYASYYFTWSGNLWKKWIESRYNYSADNFVLNSVLKIYDFGSGTFVDYGDSTANYFHTVVGLPTILPKLSDVLVFPNPSSGQFTLISAAPIASLEVYTSSGQLIYQKDFAIKSYTQQVYLSGLAKGMYILKINKDLYGSKKISINE